MKSEELGRLLKSLDSPEKLRDLAEALGTPAPEQAPLGEPRAVHRAFGFEIKAGSLDAEARSVRVVASTSALDSYDEIVEQHWRLERYRANPIVLYGHNRAGFLGLGGDPAWTLPIGFSTAVQVSDCLEATLNFVDERANPFAMKVWEGFRQGSIRAVSVGFYPREVWREMRDDLEIYHLDHNELFEISAVPLPANPEAVTLNAERAREREWFRARALQHKTQVPVTAQLAAQEKNQMDIETLKQSLKMAEEALATKTSELAARTAELASLGSQLALASSQLAARSAELEKALARIQELEATLETTRKEAAAAGEKAQREESRANELEAKAQAAEVSALVGKKFGPAEEADMLELRRTNPELFAKQMKNRPDMPHTQDVTGSDPHATRSLAGKTRMSTIAKTAREAADKARAES